MLFFQLYPVTTGVFRVSLELNKKICQSEIGIVIIELNADVISENFDEEKNRWRNVRIQIGRHSAIVFTDKRESQSEKSRFEKICLLYRICEKQN